LRCGRHNT